MRNQGFSRVRRRPKPLLVVLIGLGHLVALYALARAFAPDVTASVEKSVLSTINVTITAPEETEEPPEAEPAPDEGAQGDPGREAVPDAVTAPKPKVVIKQDRPAPRASSTGSQSTAGARASGDGTGAAGSGDGTGSGRSGSGQGNGAVSKPSVKSGNLDTARDFPVPQGGRQTRFGKSVTVAFTVTADGLSKNCSVLRTSVDAATTGQVCRLVAEKIRFNPARNAAGEPVEARYGYRVDFSAR